MTHSDDFADKPSPRTPPRSRAASSYERSRWNWPIPRLHVCADHFTEALLYVMIVYTPWVFGTTTDRDMNIMNAVAYVLGALLAGKWAIRTMTGFRPIRWGENSDPTKSSLIGNHQSKTLRRITGALAILSVLVPAYCLVGALNARASYLWSEFRFVYYDFIPWLPFTYDRTETLQWFRNTSAWALIFWAVRDWLLTKTEAEVVPEPDGETQTRRLVVPSRLRRLLWVICVNGAVLSFEALIQRIAGTPKLLFFQETGYNRDAASQFGPFAYRANGAQYVNLIWPVCLGFWWLSHRAARVHRHPSKHYHLLLPCALIMGAGPTYSLSRGAAVINMASLGLCVGFLIGWKHELDRLRRLALLGVLAGVALFGVQIEFDQLSTRMSQIEEGLQGREELNRKARKMAEDYPLFGTGPGTFQQVYMLYRMTPEAYAPGQLHNDWLETRITFGWVGFLMIVGALLLVPGRWFLPGGIPMRGLFAGFIWVALVGSLVHARWDLPFQVYSIVVLFVIWCSVLFSGSKVEDGR